jgi:hypothetical protein
MSLIEELLKNSKKHSQLITLILLGIIIAGSIAGGLWIQNLNSILAEKDKLEEQHLKLIEERYRADLASKNLEYKSLELTINRVEQSTIASTSRMAQIANEIEGFAKNGNLTKEHKGQLLDLTGILIAQANLLSKEQEKLRLEVRQELDRISSVSAAKYDAPHATFISYLVKLILSYPITLILFLCIAVVFAMVLISSFKARTKCRIRLHLEKAKDYLTPVNKNDDSIEGFRKYEKWVRYNEFEFALDELEVLSNRHTVPPHFWAELTAVAERLNLKQRVVKYRKLSEH